MSGLQSLELMRLDVPFRERFEHASASRSRTETVIVRARLRGGAVGYGEGCPRSYVTGEDVPSTLALFEAAAPEVLAKVHDVETLRGFVCDHRRSIDDNPAAWCAIELAVLDALARDAEHSLEAHLGLPEVDGDFFYTAILGTGHPAAFDRLLARYREAGLRDFKLKLCGDAQEDRRRLAALRRDEGVRVDANNLWASAEDAIAYLCSVTSDNTRWVGIEEPVMAGDALGQARLADRLGVPVILDESLLRAADLRALPEPRGRWIANLRVSKLGGLLRTLEVVQAARECGVEMIVGAQVGETSLLTRAALPIARAAGAGLRGQEGAFGALLLDHDPFAPSLVFGAGGRLEAPPRAPGLGLHPDGLSAQVLSRR